MFCKPLDVFTCSIFLIISQIRQKTARTARFIIQGKSGHGSRYFKNSPGEKLTKLLNIVDEFRKEEMRKLDELKYPDGNVTVINLTILKGGVQDNVVPAEITATFDMRVSINTDLNEFEQQVLFHHQSYHF